MTMSMSAKLYLSGLGLESDWLPWTARASDMHLDPYFE